MPPTFSPVDALRIKLRAAHPELSFDVISKEDTAFVDDPLFVGELIGVVTEDMMIVDPYASSCGRFKVNPEEAYGIPAAVASQILAHNMASL